VSDVTIFYSWQTDSPNKTNRAAIKDALRFASSVLEKEFANQNLQLVLEEATRNDPGSPNIPQRIMEKIEASDIFVCDVTTINVAAKDVSRKTPNPNVLFELGYAVARLGWPRIVMLLNKAFSEQADLPFDIDRQRVSPYQLNPDQTKDKGLQDARNKLVTVAIRTILEANPPKRLGILNPEEEQRRRDIANIRWLLEHVHWPTLEAHLEASPKFVSLDILHFWEWFNGIMESKSFHLYDQVLLKKFERVHRYWGRSLAFPQHYDSPPGMRGTIFTRSSAAWTRQQLHAWKEIESANHKLSREIDELFSDIRNRYLEIDIEQTNRTAWKNHVDYEKRFDERMSLSSLRTKGKKTRKAKSTI
jgi:hypothetical protein